MSAVTRISAVSTQSCTETLTPVCTVMHSSLKLYIQNCIRYSDSKIETASHCLSSKRYKSVFYLYT